MSASNRLQGDAGTHQGRSRIRATRSGQSGPGDGTLEPPRDLLRLALAVLIFLAIGRAHQHFGFIGAVRPALVLFLVGLAYAVASPSSVRWDNAWKTWPARLVAALAALACLSIPFGISIGNAGTFFLFAYSKVVLTFFLLLVAVRGTRDLYLFVWAYVLGCGFLVYVAMFIFSLRPAGGVMRLAGLYMYDANDLGVVLSAGIPLCVVLFRNSGRWGQVLSGTILLGIGASLARSGSRGGFLGLLAVGIALLFLLRNISVAKRVGVVAVVAAGLFVTAPQGYWDQMRSLTEPTEDYNWTSPYGRKAVAERGLGYMLDHPVLGVGVGNFQRAEGVLAEVSRQRAQMGVGYRWTAAHNSFIQAGAEMGIPGLLLFCALVFGPIVGLTRLRQRMSRAWRRVGPEHRFLYDMATFLPVSLVGFAVAGFFVSFAYHDVLYILTVYVAATYLGVRRLVRASRRGPAGDRSSGRTRAGART